MFVWSHNNISKFCEIKHQFGFNAFETTTGIEHERAKQWHQGQFLLVVLQEFLLVVLQEVLLVVLQ
jgi:hypothetical protein